MIIFDFCIIPNPFSSGGRNMIFISKSGVNSLDRTIIETQEYQDIKEVLQQFGYTEVGPLQFDSSNSAPDSTINEMIYYLNQFGLNYSRELEVNVIKDLDNIKLENVSYDFDYGYADFDDNKNIPIPQNTKNKLIESKSELFKFKYKEPDVSEKVTLYFYLFLQFGFTAKGKPMIHFTGDFYDSEDLDNRNYIKIVKSEFERIHLPEEPNSLIFKSVKTQKDFLREIGMLYSGYFRYEQRVEKNESIILQEKKYPYKLIEVRKFLSPDEPIIVKTSRMGYDNLIQLSKKVKSQSIIESNQLLLTKEIEAEAINLSSFLNDKIKILSEKEEFEDAAAMKKDVEFIEGKIRSIKDKDSIHITTAEYFKIFSIS